MTTPQPTPTDIVTRLRNFAAQWHLCTTGPTGWLQFPEHYNEAADEIERLRKLVTTPTPSDEQRASTLASWYFDETSAHYERLSKDIAQALAAKEAEVVSRYEERIRVAEQAIRTARTALDSIRAKGGE